MVSLLPQMRFCAVLYYTNIRLHNFHLQLHIAPHDQQFLKVCLTVNIVFLTTRCNAFQEIHWDVKGKFGHHFEGGHVSLFDCDKGSPTIHLDVPKDPVLGWTMKLLDKNEVYIYSYFTLPEPLKIEILQLSLLLSKVT